MNVAAGKAPANRIEQAAQTITAESFDKIQPGAASAAVDQLLGRGRDVTSPPAFYKQAAADEIESQFGVKRWREWWSSSSGVTITVGFGGDGKALVKQIDDGSVVRFIGWKGGQEVLRSSS